MRTIGQLIRDARIEKKYSRAHLEKVTKIKKVFIEAIEKEHWDKLPEFPVVAGFVKNLAGALDLNTKTISAVLRRDYPPKKLPINPKPDVRNKFIWSPRMTFILGIILVSLGIVAYLVIQYINFIKPPNLVINQPKDGQVVTTTKVDVSGTTDPDATIIVNNQPVIVDDNGNFNTQLDIFSGTKEVDVKATSRSGKVTEINRKIVPELKSGQ